MPTTFNSFETDAPFTHCCDCGCSLAHPTESIVNQSYVGSECVFEFAMCLKCREQMQEQLSEDSRVAMFDFMHDRVDMDARMAALGPKSHTDDYLSECFVCKKPKSAATGYTLGAMFSGQDLIKGPFPMLMCSTCEEELAETISDETRDMWDRFISDHFPCPPSESNLPTTKPILI